MDNVIRFQEPPLSVIITQESSVNAAGLRSCLSINDEAKWLQIKPRVRMFFSPRTEEK